MSFATEHRKLAAIMFTDMVGYSALSQRNEALALELLEEHRRVVRGILPKHAGREVKTTGDGFLIEFASALAAVQCAVDVQAALHARNLQVWRGVPTAPEAERPARSASPTEILIRIGIHVGDVVVRDGDVHGDGVNLAARIEPLAGPGGIVVSRAVQEQVGNKLEAQLAPLGRAELKNIEGGLEVFRVVLPWQRGAPARVASRRVRTLQRALPWAVAAVCLAGFIYVLLEWKNSSRSVAPQTTGASVRKFELHLACPARRIGDGDELHPAISPDGRKLVYANADGLWLRWLNSTAPPTRLSLGVNITCPFWSPDSLEVGYFEGRKLMCVALREGRERLICTAPDDASSGAAGGAWLTKDQIIFGTGSAALYAVPAEGGRATVVDRAVDEEIDFHNPSALPQGRGVLLTVHRTMGIDTIAVWTAAGRKALLQIPNSLCFYPVFSPSGHVVFQRSDDAGGVWAFPFSLEKLERTEEAFRVSDVGTLPTVSQDGTLVFCLFTLDEFGRRQLVWLDRAGKMLGAFGPVLPGLGQQRLSPDGRQVVFAAGETISALDLWIVDVASGRSTAFARNPEMEAAPFWWQNGQRIVFARREGSTSRALVKSLDGVGEGELLFENLVAQTGSAAFGINLSASGNYFFTACTSPSGRTGGYFSMSDQKKEFVPLPGPYQKTSNWALAPGDRLLAYQSGESGRIEVYVVDFPGFTNKRPVSRDGGRHPLWNAKGDELFYLDTDGRTLWSARLKPDGRKFEEPTKVFDLPPDIHGGFVWWPSFYDVAPDGERFLMLQRIGGEAPAGQSARPNVVVVENWFEEFRDKK